MTFLYFAAVVLLLAQALRIIFRGFSSNSQTYSSSTKNRKDRTGLLTVHPELLNKEGDITDEDLLTVRFSNDLDPPKSSNEEIL